MKVNIKNTDLLAIAGKGLFSLDTAALTAEDGYKVFRTVKALKKAYEAFEEQRVEIIHSKVSDEEQEKARAYERASDKTAEGIISEEEYKGIFAKLEEAAKSLAPLFSDSTEVEARPISFSSYFALKKANKELKSDLDVLLEGILWEDEGNEQ